MSKMKTLFTSGAAGIVGSSLCESLRDQYHLRLLFHARLSEDVSPGDETVF